MTPPFGTFPKIHHFWRCHPSLRLILISTSPHSESWSVSQSSIASIKSAVRDKCNTLTTKKGLILHWMYIYLYFSVTNSSSGLIFVKFRALSGRLFSKNPGKNLGFCDCRFFVIWCTFGALLCRLANSSIALWMCTKSHKSGQNHKNPGVIRAIFHNRPDIRARPDLSGRLSNTA